MPQRDPEVSSIHWRIPAEHAELEEELSDFRMSGFHDPIQLRGHTVKGEITAEGANWDY